MGLIDDVVQLGLDEAGDPLAVIESTDPNVYAWAERTFERYKRRATRIEVPGSVAAPEDTTVE